MIRATLIIILLAGCASEPTPEPTRTLTGAVTLMQSDQVRRTDTSCVGTGGYNDIGPGLSVTVRDESDDIVGVGELAYQPPEGPVPPRRCDYIFTVDELPAAPFYQVEVGERGSLDFSADDLGAQGWHVELTLGG